MIKLKQLLALIALLTSGRAVSADCSFNLPGDIPESAPVYLYAAPNTVDYQLLKPAGQQVLLPLSSKLQLVCPGSGNVLRPLNTSASLVLTCSEGGLLKATNDLAFKLNALTCANHPSATLRTTTTTCGQNNQGFVYNIGFEYEGTKFAPLFQLCYEQQNEQTLYTFNKLNGAAANFSIVQSARRSLSAAGMQYTTTATNTFYTTNNQLQRFADYFGSTQTYITSSESLVRSMLVPSGDMIFGYEQLATAFYTNAAPKFQSINSGNSMRVENLARSIATYYGRELEIYNGYMGVLQLAKLNDPKDLVAIYLDPNSKLEVPKYFFKVIRDTQSDAAIVLVTMNNIYTSAVDVFCTNICVEAGMNNTNFEELSRGYTFCCELEDFKMHYKELPAEVTASNILPQPPLEPFRLARGCNFTLSQDVPDQSPVYLYAADKSKPYRLLKPTGLTTVLPTGSRLMLACTGSPTNVIQSENVSRLELVCGAGDVFRTVQNSERQLRNMSCSSLTGSTLRATSIKCGANGKGFLQEVGFEYAPNFFAHLFDVCYDNHTEHTYYTYNVLNGRAANFSIVQSVRRAFNAAGMQYSSSAANTIYTINNQLARFESYFGPDQPYITTKDFLARGHLTPDADMIFGYEQLATYYYTNAAPEFQAVNAGNWLRVENLARLLAGQLNDDLQIYNGHLGVLQLPHHRIVNSSMPIYLDDAKRIYAPEYFFKVIRHAKTNSAIVLITLNNQYATKVNVFCTDVCEVAGFGNINFSDFSRGYTFCCKLDEFLEHYEDLPADVKATELLTAPF